MKNCHVHSDQATISQLDSGIPDLDKLLRDGVIEGRMYLISGGPGTGKTTLGMQFLEEGLDADQPGLMVHGEESPEEIRAGSFRKVDGVLTKRAGAFDYKLRELEITTDGVRVGEPMSQYQGLCGCEHGGTEHDG